MQSFRSLLLASFVQLLDVAATRFLLPATTTMSDAALTSPLRLQTVQVQQISSDIAQKRLDSFLHRFRTRNLAKNSGETTTSVQLQKLADALNDENSQAT